MRSHKFNKLTGLLLVLVILICASGSQAQYPGFSDPGARGAAGGNANGGLIPVSPTVDGGTIPMGASAQVVVRFRNDGGQPVKTGLVRLYPSSTVSASVSLNQCEEEALAPGAECAVALSVKGLQAGQWRLEMLMTHSGRTRLVTATMSGQVESSGDASDKLSTDIESIPADLDFGTLNANQTLVEPVILRNVTSNPIDITRIFIDTSLQAGYALKTECKKLDPGQACIAIVSWSPKLRGRSSGVLVVEHSGPARLTSTPLAGEYQPEDVKQADVFPQAVPGRGLLVSSQTELDFGSGVETASTITVSLVNAGDADMKIKDIRISGSDNGLTFKEEGCVPGTVLKPIEACPLTIAWSPTRVGTVVDDVQIVHDGTRGVLVLPVRGAAVSTVSQDQKAIVLSGAPTRVIDSSLDDSDADESIEGQQKAAADKNRAAVGSAVASPMGVLDGYKITSFSPNRAIINGPGGSRIVFDDEETVLGGVPWYVTIQKNGIEFTHQGQRILLLFDRSLSSLNRVSASSDRSAASSSAPAAESATVSAASSEGQ